MAAVSDITIIQQPVPWQELLNGASLDSLVQDRAGVAAFMRAKGLGIVWLVDPLDGLDRRKEDPGLVEAGRSIMEPEIRAMHDEWVLRIGEAVQPEWMGLASEVNTLAALGDPDLYAAIRDMINDLAPQVQAASPGTQVFVSFQADQANGVLPPVGDAHPHGHRHPRPRAESRPRGFAVELRAHGDHGRRARPQAGLHGMGAHLPAPAPVGRPSAGPAAAATVRSSRCRPRRPMD
jgi:hypothetical protein